MSTNVIYNEIGIGYNATRRADPYIVTQLYRLLSPEDSGLYLDIGCGTGNYTIALADKGIKFYGVEPSVTMLEGAKSRESNINWLFGTAEQIPAADTFFSGVIATLTIHHWADLKGAFNEINRVLEPGACVVIFTATPEQMAGYWLNHYFPEMLKDSIRQMPSFDDVRTAALAAGFEITGTEKYLVTDNTVDYFLYAGKHRPEMYLNEYIRNGISSFSATSHPKEIKTGLRDLRADIELGSFAAIKERYNTDIGDYLFISAQKC